ncbi:MAG: type II secretion system GspH family protein [Gemmatimonadetes bacterium]|nr:type II secretion system GspH family protein [Gemmatimonadota bacterium]
MTRRSVGGAGPQAGAGGFTLIELLVAITISGIALAVVAFSWPAALDPDRRAPARTSSLEPRASISAARASAVRTGSAVTTRVASDSGSVALVTALPDGRVIGGERFGHDEVSGEREAMSGDRAAAAR